MEKIINKAICGPRKKIVFPESYDVRMLKAAEIITNRKIAKIILIGDAEEINMCAEINHIDISGCEIIKFRDDINKNQYLKEFVFLRKDKGITSSQAYEVLSNLTNLHYAGMMLQSGYVDGCVAGAANTTGDVIRAGVQTVGLMIGVSLVSSAILVDTGLKDFGEEGVFLMADVAVNPNPDAQQLAGIAVSSAQTFESILEVPARVAMLSFSTKGSAEHPDIQKVREATVLARDISKNMIIDGELQIDPAVCQRSAGMKTPDSPLAGKANVLVFPDLDAGNIGSKIPQVLYGAKGIGPLLQGLRKPFNDLSRSCSVETIVGVTAMTCLQASIKLNHCEEVVCAHAASL
ncbi:phosphate acyltransferase [Syntrophotalea acetylenica]|uniref:Phosphate acetyl/butaryl transferase domain-containing protein n=1 Tax=Syntrophotalea acetylenica TaxID=29542 RepID=A0A1L3GJP5_SYNAC|nr:phosphate acyltransferase [Syntrophotalea acetylenica]APG26139.1 hypothetical protein A7E75_02130 [Syntrophotalea acetylenica]APG45385.1 hypothetical protein A6070_10750 [Syntrophotalea acetylenica]